MDAFRPTPEQVAVIEAADAGRSALVVAGPGTGKSRTALEAARVAIRRLAERPFDQVLILSFSNATIQRLTRAAGLTLNRQERSRLRFMTYHSCAAELLSIYGRFVGLPSRVRIIDKLEERLLRLGVDDLETGDVDAIRRLAIERGLLGFDVLIPLATRLLESNRVIREIANRRYPLIIVDEFQDTSEAQWELLKALGAQSAVIAFGDPNQIIYSSLHAATERRLDEFKEWKGIETTRFSAENFRCTVPEILVFAERLLTGQPYASKSGSGVQFFDCHYRPRRRSQLALIWKAIEQQIGPNQTVGILVPSNKLVEDVAVGLRNPPADSGIRFKVYTHMARDEATYDSVIVALAALRDVATFASADAKGDAAVALVAMNVAWNTRAKSDQSVIAQARARIEAAVNDSSSALGRLITELGIALDVSGHVGLFANALKDLREFRITAARIIAHDRIASDAVRPFRPGVRAFHDFRLNRTTKGLYGYEAMEGKTHVLTYHKGKGREFDFVILVVDPRAESSRTPLDERRRLYYVCATRAKKWLGVLYCGTEFGNVLGPVLAADRGGVKSVPA
jgi:superfamily I DNA/RNA helicase